MEKECVICLQKVEIIGNGDIEYVMCPVCGNYKKDFALDNFFCKREIDFIGENDNLISTNENERKQRRALLRYYLRKETLSNKQFQLTTSWIQKTLNKVLPNPIEQIDNLLFYLGDNFSLGQKMTIDSLKQEELISVIGCIDEYNLMFILQSSKENEYVKEDNGFYLSMKGWERFNNLQKGKVAYNNVFLAMKFESQYITDNLINEMKKSLKDIKFELESLKDRQQAGLIDDQLRQRIKNSKVLVVDLSDGNNGAYWEGGFGEGLSKPVIYICDNNQFNKNKPHFDTNHHLTLTYDTKCTDETKEYYLKNFLTRLQNVIKESIK